MTTITSNNWTNYARSQIGSLAKIANDMLDIQGQDPTQDTQGTAGPQEVVDALAAIIDELTQVQSSIPAEAQGQPGEQPLAAPPVSPEEDTPKIAQLTAQVQELTKKLEDGERMQLAEQYSELFPNTKVAQERYDEVLKSSESIDSWKSKIAAIQSFNETVNSNSYRPAKTEGGFIKSARLLASSNELLHL